MLATVLSKFGPLSGLLNKPIKDLSDDDIGMVLQHFNLADLHPENVAALKEMIVGKGMNSAADLIRSPEALQEVVQFIVGGARALVSNPTCTYCGSEVQSTHCPICGLEKEIQ